MVNVNIRDVPSGLWHRVRLAAAAMGTPEKRVTIKEVVLQALAEWLEKRGY